jgi:hypothetical protein
MKITMSFLFCCLILASCNQKPEAVNQQLHLNGTWKLLSGTLIENGDTTVTEYTTGVSFIKIINENHFAFLQHDLNHGADSSAVFVAGGGPYTLKDSLYTEHLEYCNDRGWEGHDFSFVVTIKNDTLIQKGMEVIPEKGVNRLNIEVYVKQ